MVNFLLLLLNMRDNIYISINKNTRSRDFVLTHGIVSNNKTKGQNTKWCINAKRYRYTKVGLCTIVSRSNHVRNSDFRDKTIFSLYFSLSMSSMSILKVLVDITAHSEHGILIKCDTGTNSRPNAPNLKV